MSLVSAHGDGWTGQTSFFFLLASHLETKEHFIQLHLKTSDVSRHSDTMGPPWCPNSLLGSGPIIQTLQCAFLHTHLLKHTNTNRVTPINDWHGTQKMRLTFLLKLLFLYICCGNCLLAQAHNYLQNFNDRQEAGTHWRLRSTDFVPNAIISLLPCLPQSLITPKLI